MDNEALIAEKIKSVESPSQAAVLAETFKAFGHGLRILIVKAMSDGKEHSPTQLAETLGEPLGNISYHIKVLANYQVIEISRTKPVRGTIEHFYQFTNRWSSLAPKG